MLSNGELVNWTQRPQLLMDGDVGMLGHGKFVVGETLRYSLYGKCILMYMLVYIHTRNSEYTVDSKF